MSSSFFQKKQEITSQNILSQIFLFSGNNNEIIVNANLIKNAKISLVENNHEVMSLKNQYQRRGIIRVLLILFSTVAILDLTCLKVEEVNISFLLPAIVDLAARFMIMCLVFGYSYVILKIGIFLFMYAKYISVLGVFFIIPQVSQIQNLLEAVGVTAVAIDLFWFFRETLGDQLWKLAFSDSLTGLMNRGAFLSEARKILKLYSQKGKSAAVVYLDLDRFKSVNDKHGHHMGDQILEAVGKRLKSVVRKNDIVGRIGGDEFVILLTDIDERNIEEIIQRLVKTISCPVTVNGNPFCVGVSAGIAVFPEDGKTIEELTRNADKAMYEAKNRSIGYMFCSQINPEEDEVKTCTSSKKD